MENKNFLPKGTILNSGERKYTIVKVLGSGGFGITYLVESIVQLGNISTITRMAIKEHFISSLCERDENTHQISFSNPVEDTIVRARRAFIKEAQRLQTLGISHHNIVKINEIFEANNTAYYVMEYLEGETLQEYVRRRGSLNYDETLTHLRPIIDAVCTLHKNNITHYDIKPGNIILTRDANDSLRPVLIDFGLSKHYDNDGLDTSTLNIPGYSQGYAPLEQYAGLKQYTPQADVYALAATMFFCLTGQKPAAADSFDTDSLVQILDDVAPRTFIEKLQHAMAYSKNQRTEDAETFYREIYNSKPEVDNDTHFNVSDKTRIASVKSTSSETTYLEPKHHLVINKKQRLEKQNNYKPVWIVIGVLISAGVLCAFILFQYKGNRRIGNMAYNPNSYSASDNDIIGNESTKREDSKTINIETENIDNSIIVNPQNQILSSPAVYQNSKICHFYKGDFFYKDKKYPIMLAFISEDKSIVGAYYKNIDYNRLFPMQYQNFGNEIVLTGNDGKNLFNIHLSSDKDGNLIGKTIEGNLTMKVRLLPTSDSFLITYPNSASSEKANSYDINLIVNEFISKYSNGAAPWSCLNNTSLTRLSNELQEDISPGGIFLLPFTAPLTINEKPIIENQTGKILDWDIYLRGPNAGAMSIMFSATPQYVDLNDIAHNIASSLGAIYDHKKTLIYGNDCIYLYTLNEFKLAIYCSFGAHGGNIEVLLGDEYSVSEYVDNIID